MSEKLLTLFAFFQFPLVIGIPIVVAAALVTVIALVVYWGAFVVSPFTRQKERIILRIVSFVYSFRWVRIGRGVEWIEFSTESDISARCWDGPVAANVSLLLRHNRDVDNLL